MSTTTTMRAIIQDEYGAPEDVLAPRRIDKPAAGVGEALVRVHAAPVSGTDWHLVRGLPYLARTAIGLRRPRNRVYGLELAGTVEAVGDDVRTLRPGDEVFGWCAGSFAEYAAVPADQLVSTPTNLTLAQAAAVPIAALTALQGVRDRGRVQPGQQVLVTGASGGVGSYAVQIAKAYGAEVTGVCSTAKKDLVAALGADHVIDYADGDLAERGERYDVLVDIYGNPSLSACRRVLKPRGTLVLIGGTGGRWFMGLDRWLRGVLLAPFLRLQVRPLVHRDSRPDLLTVKDLIESGEVTPVLGESFPLSRVSDAIACVTAGRARGQVVVTIDGSDGDVGRDGWAETAAR